MKASELRIGNWVNMGGIPNTVSRLAGNSVTCSGMSVGCHVEPIPLTPELLMKVGYNISEEIQGLDYYKFSDCLWMLRTHEKEKVGGYQWVLPISFNSFMKSDNSILYLHQLQNFHFAFTGEELEVNL